MQIFKMAKAGAAELRQAHAAIDLPALSFTVETIEKERRELLLDGDDSAVLAAEERLAAARLERDRAEVRLAELQKRIAEATQREADEALELDRAKVERLANDLEKSLRKRYVNAVTPLVDLLVELRAVEMEVHRVNQAIGAAGWLEKGVEQIRPVEGRVFDLSYDGQFSSITRNTILKAFKKPNGLPDENFPTWPLPAERLVP
jgi:chromosome segregation ATPase